MGKIAKIVIYDNARVNGGTNYDYPGQRWVSKLGFFSNQSKPTNKFNSSTKLPLLLPILLAPGLAAVCGQLFQAGDQFIKVLRLKIL